MKPPICCCAAVPCKPTCRRLSGKSDPLKPACTACACLNRSDLLGSSPTYASIIRLGTTSSLSTAPRTQFCRPPSSASLSKIWVNTPRRFTPVSVYTYPRPRLGRFKTTTYWRSYIASSTCAILRGETDSRPILLIVNLRQHSSGPRNRRRGKLQMPYSFRGVRLPSQENHTQYVVRLRIVGFEEQSLLRRFSGLGIAPQQRL